MQPAMPMSDAPAYGLWSLVIINCLIFIIFAFSFTRPKTKRDWRSLGGVDGFHSCTVHRDVRLSSDHLPTLGLAGKPLSRAGSVLTQFRASME